MGNLQDKNDQIILKRLRQGSVEAFEQIFKMYWKPLYKSARIKLLSHDEAEEVTQQLFSSLWEKRETLLITNLSSYLSTALKNRILNKIRSKIIQEKYWEHYKKSIGESSTILSDELEYDDLRTAVETAVNNLPQKSRQVFKLSRLEGKSNAEIAGLLKLSQKSIEYHITKSLKTLKLHLKDFIFFLPGSLFL